MLLSRPFMFMRRLVDLGIMGSIIVGSQAYYRQINPEETVAEILIERQEAPEQGDFSSSIASERKRDLRALSREEQMKHLRRLEQILLNDTRFGFRYRELMTKEDSTKWNWETVLLIDEDEYIVGQINYSTETIRIKKMDPIRPFIEYLSTSSDITSTDLGVRLHEVIHGMLHLSENDRPLKRIPRKLYAEWEEEAGNATRAVALSNTIFGRAPYSSLEDYLEEKVDEIQENSRRTTSEALARYLGSLVTSEVSLNSIMHNEETDYPSHGAEYTESDFEEFFDSVNKLYVLGLDTREVIRTVAWSSDSFVPDNESWEFGFVKLRKLIKYLEQDYEGNLEEDAEKFGNTLIMEKHQINVATLEYLEDNVPRYVEPPRMKIIFGEDNNFCINYTGLPNGCQDR